MTFCGHEGVLECSGLAELGMVRERVDGKIQSGVKPPQSKKEGSAISREDAKTRRKGRERGSSLTRRRGGLGIEGMRKARVASNE
jgi:hypothetical protein